MTIATIELEVDDSAAQAFAATPAEKREQLRHLIAYLIEHFAQSTPAALLSLMDEMSKEAEDRGLTSTRLESLLNDE